MTKQEFTISMAFLQRHFGRVLSDSARDDYWGRLKNVPSPKFKRVVAYLVDNFRPTSQVPFPTFKDFLDGLGETVDQKAETLIFAIREAAGKQGQYKSVDFGNPALHMVIQRFDGWPAISMWDKKDWDIKGGRLLEAIKTALTVGLEGPEYLQGITEIQNRSSGFLEYVPEVVRVSINGERVATYLPKDIQKLLPKQKSA